MINFPSSPTLNQTYAFGQKTWVWNGYAWDLQLANADSIIVLTQTIYNQANASFIHANSAFDAANNALDIWVRGQANAAFDHANSAFISANNEAGVNVTQNTNIQLAYNHANAAFEQANVGGGGAEVTVTTFNATANGAQTTFEIGFSPVSAEAVQVTIDGLIQPETSYTANANANTITFLTAPANGEQVRVLSFYTDAQPFFFQDGTITPAKLSAETNTFISLTAAAEASAVAVALAIALG